MNPAPMRIIIVEDEAAHVEAIRRALEDAGTAAEIGVAATLQEYRESIAIDPPDIALMDLNLPDGRAVEVLSFPPEDGPFPILIMTSYGNERIAVEAMKAGALDYVVKSPGAFAVMPQTLARARREWKALQERKQAEVELQKAKQDWESIFQGIPHPTVILDPQQRILAGNRILEQLLGKSLLEIQGHKCWEIFHSPQAQGPPPGCPFERTVGSAADETVEMEIEALGGVFLVSCTPVYDGQGRLDKVIHVATDITERKRAEEVLRIGEQRFRKL
jgi:PAS domain S-box-containing protein